MALWTAFVDLIYAGLFGLSVVFGGNMGIAIVVQLPLFLGLFAAVRRGLAGSALTKPSALLAVASAALTGVSAVLAPHPTEQQRTVAVLLPAVLTFLFLWRMAAGVTIYTLSPGLIGLLQSFLVRRRSLQTIQ